MVAGASSGDVASRLAAVSGSELTCAIAGLDAAVRGKLETVLVDCCEATDTSSEKVKDYLGRHRIEERLCTAVKALLAAQPDDPTEFLVANLRDSRPKCTVCCRGPNGNLLAELEATDNLSIGVLQNMLIEKAPPPPLAYYKLLSGEKVLNPKETLTESFPDLGNLIDVSVLTVDDIVGEYYLSPCLLELLTDGTATFSRCANIDRWSSTTHKATGSFQRIEGGICVALVSFQTTNEVNLVPTFVSEMQPAEVQLDFEVEKLSLKLSKLNGGPPFSVADMGDMIGKVLEKT